MMGTDADSATCGATTAPSPTTTPSTIVAREPMNAPSSTITGLACGGSSDEARHENDAPGQERAVACDSRWDDPHSALGVVRLHRDLVQEVEASDLHRLDLAQAEVEENRLLRPLVDEPLAVALLGHPHLTLVEQSNGLLDRRRIELVILPEGVDL